MHWRAVLAEPLDVRGDRRGSDAALTGFHLRRAIRRARHRREMEAVINPLPSRRLLHVLQFRDHGIEAVAGVKARSDEHVVLEREVVGQDRREFRYEYATARHLQPPSGT